jgi:sirohydrochlorin cobaltochelatase
LRKADEVVAKSGESIADPARTACLFICGHGTSLNDNSTKIIHFQTEQIRALGRFADCQGVLMEQAPFVKNWRTLTDCRDVIVVPFFISDGLHSFEDIPRLLGMRRESGGWPVNPLHENGRRLWYATAIGTEPSFAEVIMAQVGGAIGQNSDRFRASFDTIRSAPPRPLAPLLETPLPWNIGQVLIERGYELRHREDSGLADLRELTSLAEIREWVRLDEAGIFRPLPAAPNLRRGWRYLAPDETALREALEYIYPAEVANAELWRESQLSVTPWTETAERQTGRFRVARELDRTGVRELVAQVCDRGCLKQRLWEPVAQRISSAANEIPLLCPEACNYLVGKVREKLKGPEMEE